GEIEARGAALTPAGRALYDRLLGEADAAVAAGEARNAATARCFAAFPDAEEALRERELAFFDPRTGRPLVYEDFLPVSAAGIFRSNLAAPGLGGDRQGGDRQGGDGMAPGERGAFEAALGAPVLDEMALYARDAAGTPEEPIR
ncbi:MAG: DUF1338 family protein, partial [Gluconacetobacter diazotrophicus]|nr:DUF1338 family protein [Gluconacetobacter diazotrophicus]